MLFSLLTRLSCHAILPGIRKRHCLYTYSNKNINWSTDDADRLNKQNSVYKQTELSEIKTAVFYLYENK